MLQCYQENNENKLATLGMLMEKLKVTPNEFLVPVGVTKNEEIQASPTLKELMETKDKSKIVVPTFR